MDPIGLGLFALCALVCFTWSIIPRTLRKSKRLQDSSQTPDPDGSDFEIEIYTEAQSDYWYFRVRDNEGNVITPLPGPDYPAFLRACMGRPVKSVDGRDRTRVKAQLWVDNHVQWLADGAGSPLTVRYGHDPRKAQRMLTAQAEQIAEFERQLGFEDYAGYELTPEVEEGKLKP